MTEQMNFTEFLPGGTETELQNVLSIAFQFIRVHYLQACELPGLVIGLGALTRKRLSKVHFDQLPIWSVADVAKYTASINTQIRPIIDKVQKYHCNRCVLLRLVPNPSLVS